MHGEEIAAKVMEWYGDQLKAGGVPQIRKRILMELRDGLTTRLAEPQVLSEREHVHLQHHRQRLGHRDLWRASGGHGRRLRFLSVALLEARHGQAGQEQLHLQFPGGNVATPDLFDIAGGATSLWTAAIAYGGSGGVLFTTVTTTTPDPCTRQRPLRLHQLKRWSALPEVRCEEPC